MGTPQSISPKHRRGRVLESVGKLCTLVIGLPLAAIAGVCWRLKPEAG